MKYKEFSFFFKILIDFIINNKNVGTYIKP